MFTFKASSALAVIATIDPVVIAATELFSDVVDMSKYDSVLAFALTGDMVVGSTFDFRFVQCDSNGANPTASLRAMTQRAADATLNDNIQLVMVVRAAELAAASKRYGKFGMVGASTGGPVALLVLGVDSRYDVASVNQLATVVETK